MTTPRRSRLAILFGVVSVSLLVATQSGSPAKEQKAATIAASAESVAAPPEPARLTIRTEGDEHLSLIHI